MQHLGRADDNHGLKLPTVIVSSTGQLDHERIPRHAGQAIRVNE